MTFQDWGFNKRGFGVGRSYASKVLSIANESLIGYWPGNETSGTNADNAEGTAARDGTYTAVTLNNSVGPDGQPVGLWDGSTSVCDIYSASLNTAFSGAAGTVSFWSKVSGAGVWTDGVSRDPFQIAVGSNDFLLIRKDTANNRVDFMHEANNVRETITVTSHNPIVWTHYVMTWSEAGDFTKAYISGEQVGSTQTGLGVWSGALSSTTCTFGAANTTPGGVWDGWLAHLGVWTSALSDAQALQLSRV